MTPRPGGPYNAAVKALAAFCLPFSLLVLNTACTRTPEIPTLPNQPKTRAETLILGDHLNPEDVKALFSVMNEDHRFDELAALFESPSTRELEEISELLNRYVYQSAQDSSGLVEILSRRTQNRGFSEWKSNVATWEKEQDFAALVELAAAFWSDEQFDRLASRAILLLDPTLAALLERLESLPEPEKKGDWESLPLPSADAFFTDLDRFLSSESLVADSVRVAQALDESAFGEALVLSTRFLRDQYKSAAPFEGFAYGMRKMLSTVPDKMKPARNNKLDLLLYFAEQANGSTGGFFGTIEKELDKDPMLMHVLSEFANPVVTWSVQRSLSKKLANKEFWTKAVKLDAAAQKEIFKQVYRGIATIRGYHQSTEVAVNPFFSNLTTELNAYALSLWLEDVIRSNKEEIEKLLQAEEFSADALWALPVKEVKLHVSFIEWKTEGDKTVATFPHHDAMKMRSFFSDTLEQLETYLERKLAADFSYRFQSEGSNLGTALESAVKLSNDLLSYADTKAFLTSLAVFVARPEKGILTTFDSNNIMDSLNGFIASQSLFFLRRVKGLVFEDLKLGSLPWQGEGGLEGFLQPFFKNDPELLKKVEGIVGSIQPIYYFDSSPLPARGLPTPFELYHSILHFTRTGFVQAGHGQPLTELLAWVSKARFAGMFEKAGETYLEYPGVGGWLLETNVIYRWLDKVSQLKSERDHAWIRSESETLLEAMERLLGVSGKESGLKLWLDSLKPLVRDKPSSVRAGIERLLASGPGVLPDIRDLSETERRWVTQLVQKDDHVVLHRFLSEHLDRKKALALVEKLAELSRDGSVRKALNVLSHLDNDRIHHLSQVLAQWESSGEMAAFLDAARRLLLAVQTPPKQIRETKPERAVRLEKWLP